MMPLEMTCREVEEHVTGYLDGELHPDDRKRFEAHVRGCPECGTRVSQLRQTVSTLGQLRPSGTPAAEPGVLELFRTRGLHAPHPHVRSIPLGLGNELA